MNAILAEMQKEIWVMEPRALDALFMQVAEIKVDISNLAGIEVVKTPRPVINGDTAIIAIRGVLMKRVPFIFRLFGIETMSYIDIQNQLEEALGNDQIKKILLDIDSPGGAVASVMETGQAIANAARQKDVSAYIEDLGASGAYWLASQTSKISAGPNTEVGSIGVYTVYVDYSKMAEMEGVTIHVIRSGEHKGMGVMGAKITDEQLTAKQEIIDGMADNFIKAVSSGRKMSIEVVRKLADGRLWLAENARKNGLIDSITNETANQQTNNPDSKGKNMAEEQTNQIQVDEKAIVEKAKGEARSEIAEFQKAFADDPQFAIEQFTKGVSLETAKANYAEVLKVKNAALEQEKIELEKKVKANNKGPDPIIGDGEGDEQAGSFIETARQLAKDEKITMTEAMKRTKKENPELYEGYRKTG